MADEVPGSALNDGAPLHPHTTDPPLDPVPGQPAGEEKKRKKKEVPEWQRPEVLAAYDNESVSLINAMDLEIDALFDDALAKKATAKVAKDGWEAKRDELGRLIKERKLGRGKPVQKTLFDQPAGKEEPPPAFTVEAIPVATPSELENLWQSYPLDRCGTFGMTPRDIDILASGERKGGYATYPVRTVGEMAAYTAGDGSNPRHIGDFRGLGSSGETRIGAALEGFWGWWNKGGMEEYAKEKGLTSGNPNPQPDAGGSGANYGVGDLGDAIQPGGAGGATDDDGEQVGATVVIVEHLLNDPDAKPEEEATVPAGAGDTFDIA